MPRKPLGHRRKPEILSAFARCIGRLGIAGTSLDAVATEAGMRRSILRHFVGNRERLLEETTILICEQAGARLEQLLAVIPVWAEARRVGETILQVPHAADPLTVFDVMLNDSAAIPPVARMVEQRFRQLVGVLADWLRGWSGQPSEATAEALLALRRQLVCRHRLGGRGGRELAVAIELLDRLKPDGAAEPAHEVMEPETEIGVND